MLLCCMKKATLSDQLKVAFGMPAGAGTDVAAVFAIKRDGYFPVPLLWLEFAGKAVCRVNQRTTSPPGAELAVDQLRSRAVQSRCSSFSVHFSTDWPDTLTIL